jgi:threonine dehydratase
MPTTTPQVKIDAVRERGGEWVQIVLHGESYSDAYLHAAELEEAQADVHPPVRRPRGHRRPGHHRDGDPAPAPGPIHAIFVAIGGGGLISGIAAYVKAVRPEIKVIGVQTFDSDAMKRSVDAGKRVELKDVGLFSDGTAVKLVGKETFRITRELVDDIILVDTDAICAA